MRGNSVKPKALIVSINFFSPEFLDGVNKITYNLLKENPYYGADFLSLLEGSLGENEEENFKHVKISSLKISPSELNRKNKIITWLLGLSPLISLSEKVSKRVASALIDLSDSYDKLILSHLGFGSVFKYLPPDIRKKVILLAVDSYHLYMSRRVENEKNVLKKHAFKWELFLSKRWEDSVYKAAPTVVYVSEYDAVYARGIFPEGNFRSINLGVDTDFFRMNTDSIVNENQIVFTGNFGYGPNIEAANFLAREVLPLLNLKRPKLKLILAGSNPSSELKSLESNNLIVTGFVDDLRGYVWESALFVCPLTFGSGMKNKFLEAMALEKISLVSELTTHGIECENNKHCVVVKDNSPQTWANVILECLEKREELQILGQEGRQLILSKYSWDQVRKTYGSLF